MPGTKPDMSRENPTKGHGFYLSRGSFSALETCQRGQAQLLAPDLYYLCVSNTLRSLSEPLFTQLCIGIIPEATTSIA